MSQSYEDFYKEIIKDVTAPTDFIDIIVNRAHSKPNDRKVGPWWDDNKLGEREVDWICLGHKYAIMNNPQMKGYFDQAIIELLDPVYYVSNRDYKTLEVVLDLAQECYNRVPFMSEGIKNLKRLIQTADALGLRDITGRHGLGNNLYAIVLLTYAQHQQGEKPEFWMEVIENEPLYATVAFTGLRRCDITVGEDYLPKLRTLAETNPEYTNFSVKDAERALKNQQERQKH